MKRAITVAALAGFLLVGAVTASILGPESVSLAGGIQPAMLAASAGSVSNREAKADRLQVVTFALASLEPAPTAPAPSESLRQAYASTSPADIQAPRIITAPSSVPAAPPKPKLVSKPQPAKPYTLLSDDQIAGIKERLKLSSSQEYYWPAVETALRAVARKIHATRHANPAATATPIDPDAAEVQQLKSAAMPLLFQLREDQKSEVRTLARLIGLEKVAAQI